MKTLTVFVILVLVSTVAFAQSGGGPQPEERLNSLSLGLGGGGLVGIAYDRVVWKMDQLAVSANIGAGYLIFGAGFPHGLVATYGENHKIEAGVMATFLITQRFSLGILGPADNSVVMTYRVTPLLGYRHQRPDGGLVFRLYFSPFMHNDSTLVDNDNSAEFTFIPWGGMTFGFSF